MLDSIGAAIRRYGAVVLAIVAVIAMYLALAVIACTPASASQGQPNRGLIVGAHLLTTHLGSNAAHYRSVTPGLYVRSASGGLTLGAYNNSHGRASIYAAWTWQHGPFALTAGAVTGYERRSVMPLVIPSVALPMPGSAGALRVALVPKPPYQGSAGGVHLAWEKPL